MMEGRGILVSYIEAALTSPDRVARDTDRPGPEPLIKGHSRIRKTACFAWFTGRMMEMFSW